QRLKTEPRGGVMGRRIAFERGDRLEELLEQLAGATRLLDQHDRGSDDDALAEAVVQLLIAEETLTRAVDDLLEEAVVHGGESLRGLAAMCRAVSTDRRPNHASLVYRLRRGQQWRARYRRGLRMTARPEEMQPGDWLDLDGTQAGEVEAVGEVVELGEQVLVRLRDGSEVSLPRHRRQRILRPSRARDASQLEITKGEA